MVSCKYYTEEQFNSDVQLNKEVGISVIHFNARSLNRNFYKIMGCIHALKCSFDIIAITKTWADQTNSTSDYNMPGYNVFNTVRINNNNNIFESKLITNKSVVLDNILECVTVEINLKKE